MTSRVRNESALDEIATQLSTPEGAEALLAGIASGIFPSDFGAIHQMTWAEPRRHGKGIAPRETTEERLLAAEVRFRTLVEQIPAVTFMAVLGEGLNEVYVSPHIETMLGFTQAEWLENPFLWYNQLHPDDRKLWNEEFTRGCQTGGPFRAECRFISRTGQTVWVHGEARLVKDAIGRPQFLQGVAFDITETKRAQAVLVENAVRSAKIEEELAIARRVQTSILPRTFAVDGLEIAATMEPAEDVGGDYYDVFPSSDGAWLAIGDVSGHGLDAGLVMLMVQSALAGIAATRPDASPAEVIGTLNTVLYDNICNRLASNEYVTLVLLRYSRDGRVVFAGAHEHILVCREATGRVERIETPGPWIGIRRDVRDVAVNNATQLLDGDVIVLFTDGLIEAMNRGGEQFDMNRVCQLVEEHRLESPDAIQRHLLDALRAWRVIQEDDVSVVVARFREPVAGDEPRSTPRVG
jgi:PAS domain S-box-containing protein